MSSNYIYVPLCLGAEIEDWAVRLASDMLRAAQVQELLTY